MRIARQRSSIGVLTPAKLNLVLKVLGRRNDGFHAIETLMVSVRLYDHLYFSPALTDQISLSVQNVELGAEPISGDCDNLVYRAAELLQSRYQVETGVRIDLIKRIPSQAGLGGGSSDAAATLVALNQYWSLGLAGEELHRLAAELGSDINFFLDSHLAAWCTGRGEKISPVALSRNIPFVIVKPPIGLSTARVFTELNAPLIDDLSLSPADHRLKSSSCAALAALMKNDLSRAACQVNVQIAELLSALRSQCLNAEMTGSGSACFGLCHSFSQARKLARRFNRWRGYSAFAATTGL